MKAPFQLNKNALRPHQVQGAGSLGLRPWGEDGRPWCQGCSSPRLRRPSPWHRAAPAGRCEGGVFAAIVPAADHMVQVRGAVDADSHGGPNGHTFAFCSGRPTLSHLKVTVPLQVAMRMSQKYKNAQRVPTSPLSVLSACLEAPLGRGC